MYYIIIGIILGILIYFKIIKPSRYWEEKGIAHEPSWPILGKGNTAVNLYRKYPDSRYVGYMQFNHPVLLLRDIELIQQIAIKDFDHFHDHFFANSDQDSSKNLVNLTGESWKQMRTTLNSDFTDDKMKEMYQVMAKCAENFFGNFKGKEPVAVEIKNIFSRFATDVILSVGSGVRINSLKHPNNNFFKMGTFGIVVFLKTVLSHISKTISQIFLKDATTIKNNIRVSDQNGSKLELTDEQIAAQTMLFVSGFDTVSTTSAFMAHELAVNPDIQKKLQQEIDSINQSYKTRIPFEALLSMKYLDQVVCETLRLWPPSFQTDRVCTKNYKIPATKSTERDVMIEKGVSVLIPVMGLHRDPHYYPEPDQFNPERFNDQNKSKIPPGTYIPFGIGPRNCSKFALLEIKTLFFQVLSKFDIVPINDTQIPLEIAPTPVKGFRLGLKPRKTFY